MKTTLRVLALCFSGPIALAACGDDEETNTPPPSCDVAAQTGCAAGQVCEDVQGKTPACFAPLTVKGRVFDTLDAAEKGIANARVVARDANDAAVSTVAVSAADGTYSLTVPAPRDGNGVPLARQVTLRADASGYDTFPKAPRVAIPVELADAAGSPPVVQSAATDIGLIPLENATGLGSISGKVTGSVTSAATGEPILAGGTLVVAGNATGIADLKGDFVVFNVPAGDVEVHGYAQGLQITPATAAVTAGKETPNVELKASAEATATISGHVQIVNPGDGSTTSVILVVEDTFNPTAARGEAPKGLRVGNVDGAWSIPSVPDGKYVVLAAFENDFLVRDPDTSIGGTEIVHITVAGSSQELSQSFKVTGALAVVSPGASAIDEVSGTPTFVWEDDSSEDMYQLQVFDALGNLVWEDLAVPSVSGSKDVSRDYAGTQALEPGMIYQFRATSMKDGVPISATEDLKGVFVYK